MFHGINRAGFTAVALSALVFHIFYWRDIDLNAEISERQWFALTTWWTVWSPQPLVAMRERQRAERAEQIPQTIEQDVRKVIEERNDG